MSCNREIGFDGGLGVEDFQVSQILTAPIDVIRCRAVRRYSTDCRVRNICKETNEKKRSGVSDTTTRKL